MLYNISTMCENLVIVIQFIVNRNKFLINESKTTIINKLLIAIALPMPCNIIFAMNEI